MSDLSCSLFNSTNASTAVESLANQIVSNVAQIGTSGTICPSTWSQATTQLTAAYQPSRYVDEEPSEKAVELELADGTRIVKKFDPSKIDELHETTSLKVSFKKSFPFISVQTQAFTSFSYYGRHYSVKCTMRALAKIFNIDFTDFDVAVLEDAIAHG